MTILKKYFFNKLVVTSLIILFAITMLLLVLQATQFLDLTIGKGLPLKYLGYISVLSLPRVWIEITPIIILIAIIFTWQVMLNNNEIVIMKAAGLNNFEIIKPTLFIGIITSVICALLATFVINTAYVKYSNLKDQLYKDFNLKIIGKNKFMELTPEITIYLKSTTKGGVLQNVLIDINHPNEEITIYAEKATLIKDKSILKLLLNTGSIQKLDKVTQGTTFVNFDYYVLNLNLNKKTAATKRETAKVMYLWELLFYKHLNFMHSLYKTDLKAYYTKAQTFVIEADKRIINVVLCLFFTIICAYFFSKSSYSRSAQFAPSLNSFGSCLALKIYCSSVLVNSVNLGFIAINYFLIIGLAIYLLLKIRYTDSIR